MTNIKPTEKEILTLADAYTNAYLYGIGVVKIVNTPRGPEMSVVPCKDYLAVAEQMKRVTAKEIEYGNQPTPD